MDDCACFADNASPERVYDALRNKIDLIESWAGLNRISFGVYKCFFHPHKLRAKQSLTCFAEPILYKNEVIYLARIALSWSLKLHLKDLGNAIRQKSHITSR
jgi:hypothetical protein